MNAKKYMFVQNLAQKVLFEMELLGQISDGYWENASPFDHWKSFSNIEVLVDETGKVGCNFFPRKTNYNFASRQLLEVVGERMIFMVKLIIENPDLAEKFSEGHITRLPDSSDDFKHWGHQYPGITASHVEKAEASTYSKRQLMSDLVVLKAAVRGFRAK